MKRKVVVFFSALLFSITMLTELLYPQVKIKEKVEISPGERLQSKSGNQLEKFNCDVGWDNQLHKLKFYYEIVSGESNISIYATLGCWNPTWITYSNTGIKSASVEINNATDGYYEFHYGVDTNIAVTIHHKYYIDDSLYTEGESTGIDVFGSFYINCCLLPTQYFRYFTLQPFKTSGNCNNPLSMEIQPDFDNNLCISGTKIWDANMPVDVTINDESGHIKFYNKKTRTISGNSILVDYLSLNSDYVIFSDLPLGADRLRCEITFEWYDSTETRETYYFYPPGLFYLDEDQLEYLGTCSMYFDNDCYPLDLNDLENDDLTITITQGGDYVSIISDYTQQIVGDNMTIAFDSLYYFSLINDVACDSDKVVIVRSEINGLVQTDTVIVTPPKIKVMVDPAELSPGDTAKIILLQRYPDGTYASFPEGQLFYPDLTTGYDYASILYNGEAEDYFYEVPDSLKLRADDLGELDSVEVILRVGTYITTEIPVSALKVEEENTERVSNIPPTDDEARPINNKVKKKKDDIKPKLIGGGGWDEYVEGYAKATIKEKKCDKILPICNDPPIFPTVKLAMNPRFSTACNGNEKDALGNILKIQSGGFKAISWNNTQTIFSEPCYNKNDDFVHFNINIKEIDAVIIVDTIKPQAVLSICWGQLREAGKTIISSDEDMLNILRANPLDSVTLRKDLESLRHYDGTNIKYFFEAEIYAHENKHKSNYEFKLDSLRIEKFENKIKNYKQTCKEFKKNKELNIQPANKEFWNIVKSYIDDAIKATERFTEESVQTSDEVQNEVEHFLTLLDQFKNGTIK